LAPSGRARRECAKPADGWRAVGAALPVAAHRARAGRATMAVPGPGPGAGRAGAGTGRAGLAPSPPWKLALLMRGRAG